jgi:hypothetical protein
MNNYNETLKAALQKITKFVFEILEVIDEKGILIRQIHEDAVSSIFLKQISKLREQNICIKAKSLCVYEGKTGMDFDLWIGENDNSYIRLIVQAKSFGNQTSTDNSYNISVDQCNKIIEYSKENHESFPLYFLYQYIKDSNLKKDYFSFISEFINEHSSITFTSAYNIQNAAKEGKLKFSDIHKNDFKYEWKNNIYDLFQHPNESIGLPLYLLNDITPSKINKFQKLISEKHNSLKFFFFFQSEEPPFKIHKISASEIESKYGQNNPESELQFKNLLIINNKLNVN